jgi:hypothetical protein
MIALLACVKEASGARPKRKPQSIKRRPRKRKQPGSLDLCGVTDELGAGNDRARSQRWRFYRQLFRLSINLKRISRKMFDGRIECARRRADAIMILWMIFKPRSRCRLIADAH